MLFISQLPLVRLGIRGKTGLLGNEWIILEKNGEKVSYSLQLKKVCFSGRTSAVWVCFASQVWSDKRLRASCQNMKLR